jgi:hypothetical protein
MLLLPTLFPDKRIRPVVAASRDVMKAASTAFKGDLNPNVPLRDGGIADIGDVAFDVFGDDGTFVQGKNYDRM